MTRMTGGSDCAVMCNLINTRTHTLQQYLFENAKERIYLVHDRRSNYLFAGRGKISLIM